ncbi:flagellar hook-associated protein FlgK [Burkholderia sp. Ac-20379]|uniref:flagellar hook-associated protein FlgK n=1 Tax=Burkholderia sp. Ac-20379 TaxID=2703900 RepID=UPI00197F4BA1|nr:flagellar hook-associated protein FlgK [Burkholderia sp. Ac-20379]MBN3727297.1 flagellar hook-associated protein FlgK [Burkholderia sp. Ac-20379]
MRISQIGLSGTHAAQAALGMSARNTANLMTKGYTRQGVLLTPRVGGGVTVQSLIRFSDEARTQQMWQSNAMLGRQTAGESYFAQLEQVMSLEDGSVKAGLDGLFAALDEASVDPMSAPLRQQVITSADAFAKSINGLLQTQGRQLDTLRQQAGATARQINALSGTVADLNRRIAEGQASGNVPSEWIDQRDQALDTLAGLVDIRTLRQPDGSVDVSLAAGPPLVAGHQVATLDVRPGNDGTFSLALALGGAVYPLDGEAAGGAIGGLFAFADGVLMPQMAGAKSLAGELAQRMNAQLAAGFGTDGQPGEPLFDIDAASGMLHLRAGVTPDRLGFSSDPATPGDSGNLLALIALRQARIDVPGLGETAIGDVYTMLVGRLGSQSSQNQAALETASELRTQAEQAWQSVSGVSMDEEAVNISETMQIYNANMKVISVANALFATTLNSF